MLLFGTTWSLGLTTLGLSANKSLNEEEGTVSIVFQYVFVVTNGLQV